MPGWALRRGPTAQLAFPALFTQQDEPLYKKQLWHFTLHSDTTVSGYNGRGFALLGGKRRLTSKTDLKCSHNS